jgi:flavin-dependent dehydrogenase
LEKEINPGAGSPDAVVLGGGPAGSAAAIILARAGRQVLLLDQADANPPAMRWGESLPGAANPLLQTLGVSPHRMSTDHLLACGVQSAWGSAGLRSSDAIRDPRGHGWHLDRHAFDKMLREMASDQGAMVDSSARVIDIAKDHGNWDLNFRCGQKPGGRSVTARWLIDCTGRKSWFASRIGIRRRCDDRQIAFAEIFQPMCGHDVDTATLIESVSHGWWYTARIPNGNRIAVYLTNPDSDSVQLARGRVGFEIVLSQTKYIQTRLKNYEMTLDPVATAAGSSRLEVSWGSEDRSAGWVAAGDSSVSFDPLSSQGIFHALYSGIAAAKAVNATLSGDRSALPAYQARMDHVYEVYRQRRTSFYALEQRWPQASFWRSCCRAPKADDDLLRAD